MNEEEEEEEATEPPPSSSAKGETFLIFPRFCGTENRAANSSGDAARH